jgi:hypothetical protein
VSSTVSAIGVKRKEESRQRSSSTSRTRGRARGLRPRKGERLRDVTQYIVHTT